MPRGRGRGGFGRLYNPYISCRRFPWLPRWWWAYPGYGLQYYGTSWSPSYPRYAYPRYGRRPY